MQKTGQITITQGNYSIDSRSVAWQYRKLIGISTECKVGVQDPLQITVNNAARLILVPLATTEGDAGGKFIRSW